MHSNDVHAKKKRTDTNIQSSNDASGKLQAASNAQKKRKKKRRLAELGASTNSGSTNIAPSEPTRTKSSGKISAVTDTDLANIYAYISAGKSSAALNAIEALLTKAPNHKLLHLLRADVLLILSQGTKASEKWSSANTLARLGDSQQQQLHMLQQEAWLRLNSHANRVKASVVSASGHNLVPRQLLKLADNEPYALVVDSKLSRLYVYQNVANGPPKLLNDFYVTQGKQGLFKNVEGDQRTPIGAYFISGPIDKKLPDLYGYGALNMDYPNTWDRRLGRTGHGIWLHGVPSETYARAPYASDGCVALANPDMEKLMALKNNGSMPIVIVEKLEWVDSNAIDAQRKPLIQALNIWIKANAPASNMVNLAALEYPGENGMLLTRFELITDSSKRLVKKELYWKKESGNWKVAVDNTL